MFLIKNICFKKNTKIHFYGNGGNNKRNQDESRTYPA